MATAKKATTKKAAPKKATKKLTMAEIKRQMAGGKLTKEQANKLRRQYMDSIEYK
jgi:hypothetical protein